VIRPAISTRHRRVLIDSVLNHSTLKNIVSTRAPVSQQACDPRLWTRRASGRRWLGTPPRSATPSAPDPVQASRSPPATLSAAAYEFTPCDQGADCVAALVGSPLAPAGVSPGLHGYDTGTGPAEEPRSDWRRAVAVVSERRVAQGRALYTKRSGDVQGGPEQRARALRPAGEPTRSAAALHQPQSRRPSHGTGRNLLPRLFEAASPFLGRRTR